MNTAVTDRLTPVILCGGTGSRLWPLSRQDYPKQLLNLAGQQSLLQQTLLRFADTQRFDTPLLICNEAYRFAVAEQVRQLGLTAHIMLEPMGKNTAPAATLAALSVPADTLLLVVAADHYMRRVDIFHAAVKVAADTALAGYLVTFGIQPTAPETGYGYIEVGAPLTQGVHRVKTFAEKPDQATAQRYLDAGSHLWNAGMFVFQAGALLTEMDAHQPQLLAACRNALANMTHDLDFQRLAPQDFEKIPADSIDYAVFEKTDKAAVVPVDGLGWSDVGAWSSLWDIDPAKDSDANAKYGGVYTHNVQGSYLRTHDKQLLAVVGLDNVIVITTKDAVLVLAKDKAQDVKHIVAQLQAQGRAEILHHRQVYRPWGSYESLDEGERFQVKRLVVNPGQKLSLQKHFHRAEHWVVVQGTALVQRDDEQILLRENESVYLPLGARHRLENPGKIVLVLVEVQSGAYLGEDDIVRFDDTYGRV